MPGPMTPEEANEKTCPFMSPDRDNALITCGASACACWGWVDPARGEEDHTNSEVISLTIGKIPEGDGWSKVGSGITGQIWRRTPVKGPRRGQCEAMSPNIEVSS